MSTVTAEALASDSVNVRVRVVVPLLPSAWELVSIDRSTVGSAVNSEEPASNAPASQLASRENRR